MAPSHPSPEAVAAGQAVYSARVLKLYDLLVHGLSNHLIWRCPTKRLRQLYQRCVSERHLDVGVGSGYFLEHTRFPGAAPRVTLIDLNPACLDYAGRRLARLKPATLQADVFQPLPRCGPFASIGLTYLLHCLPGSIPEKARVLDNIGALGAPGAVLFGATLLQGDAPRSWIARRLMETYNRKGVFSNREDRFEDLESALKARFTEVTLERVGCAALFTARIAV